MMEGCVNKGRQVLMSILFRLFPLTKSLSKTTQLHSRFMSVAYKTVLVTDPCYVNNADNYQDYITLPIRHNDANTVTLKNYIPLRITDTLYNRLNKALLAPSAISDEDFYLFDHHEREDNVETISDDISSSLDKYTHIGTHHSDSGMTCIIDEDPFHLLHVNNQTNNAATIDNNIDRTSSPVYEEVDWQDFVLSTLSDELTQPVDRDSFPLYLWYGRIPNGGSAIQVHVKYDEDGVVDGMLFKADIDHDNEEEDARSEEE